MTVLTMDQLTLLVGEGRRHDTSRDQNGHKTFSNLPSLPETIQQRIYKVVVIANGAVSRADIAKALGLKKTPWFLSALEQLCQDGCLTRSHIIRPNGSVMFYYEVKR